jgi:hypothetical protein
MEAVDLSERSITINHTTQRHIPRDSNFKIHVVYIRYIYSATNISFEVNYSPSTSVSPAYSHSTNCSTVILSSDAV